MVRATRRQAIQAATVALSAVLAVPAGAEAIDRIGVPGPLSFAGTPYALAWSAQPTPAYYKQEYLPAGQTVERYGRMLLVELLEGGSVASAASAQVRTINARKGKDPLANLAVIENKQSGEIIVDFLIGGRDAQGGEIAEWNAYRYASFKGANGRSGVLLFAISHRAYGNEAIGAFLGRLKTFRSDEIKRLAAQTLPSPSLGTKR
ncbi:hypothetical protein GGC47_001535 [Bosea sp. OAE752]|uniref:hypothetical protein n=1 Tax=Bosea sp. OAE752 TaxID=2663873 RepID=UPI000DD7E935